MRILRKSLPLLALVASVLFTSCSKKPAELQELGMKAYAAGEYAKAQEYFAEGIKKEGTRELYAGFIAANLMTGKYPAINTAYNGFCDDIHASLVARYGKGLFLKFGIVTDLKPYNTHGSNELPPDYSRTIMLQESAFYSGYMSLKGQIDSIVRK